MNLRSILRGIADGINSALAEEDALAGHFPSAPAYPRPERAPDEASEMPLPADEPDEEPIDDRRIPVPLGAEKRHAKEGETIVVLTETDAHSLRLGHTYRVVAHLRDEEEAVVVALSNGGRERIADADYAVVDDSWQRPLPKGETVWGRVDREAAARGEPVPGPTPQPSPGVFGTPDKPATPEEAAECGRRIIEGTPAPTVEGSSA